MGSWSGHTLPGSLFILYGLTWAIKTSYRYFFTSTIRPNTGRRCAKFRSEILEALSKIILAGFGLLIEQLLPWEPWFRLTEKTTNEFTRANNWSHSTMYAFFLISGIVDILVMKMPKVMPHCIHHICHGLAYAIEGYLFYFHTHGREELDIRVHVLLIIAIWPVSLILFLLATIDNNTNFSNGYVIAPQLRHKMRNDNMLQRDTTSLLNDQNEDNSDENIQLREKSPSSGQWTNLADDNQNYYKQEDIVKVLSNQKKIFTMELCMAIAIILQGTWFWQTAYVLYPPNGEPWEQGSHKNIAFLTMFFAWHLLLAMLVVAGIFMFFGILSCKTRRQSQNRSYLSLRDELP
ncbi:transmembrane protein 45B-like [Styela clava]|uniref:transmembrane protein 45B-like n=1 Tax=Styela clava TaxID=7725 RepID=UPI0019393015|nr:transmembrane protein 45B-like [Styela clava]